MTSTAHLDQLVGLSLGKGCIRYRQPDQVDWDVISSLLADTCASTDQASTATPSKCARSVLVPELQ